MRPKAADYVEIIPDAQAMAADKEELLDVMAGEVLMHHVMGRTGHKQTALALQESCVQLMR